jgi:hypothetical protein
MNHYSRSGAAGTGLQAVGVTQATQQPPNINTVGAARDEENK